MRHLFHSFLSSDTSCTVIIFPPLAKPTHPIFFHLSLISSLFPSLNPSEPHYPAVLHPPLRRRGEEEGQTLDPIVYSVRKPAISCVSPGRLLNDLTSVTLVTGPLPLLAHLHVPAPFLPPLPPPLNSSDYTRDTRRTEGQI